VVAKTIVFCLCTGNGIQNTIVVVSVADPMRNVSWMLFPGGTELGTQVKKGSRAVHTNTLNNPQVECTGIFIVCN